jgi:hypothetical protein
MTTTTAVKTPRVDYSSREATIAYGLASQELPQYYNRTDLSLTSIEDIMNTNSSTTDNIFIKHTFLLNFLREWQSRKKSMSDTIVKEQISGEVLSFCSNTGILNYLYKAIDIAEKCFDTTIKKRKTELEQDPETGEKWIAINITIEGEVEDFLTKYDDYINNWVSATPWPERDKIRLSYNIV